MFKTPRYIVCYSPSSPKPVKRPANPIWCNCQNICTWKRTLKTILRKKSHFLSWSTSLLHKLLLLKLWLILRLWPVQVCFTGTGITLGDVQLNYLNWFLFLIVIQGLLIVGTSCMIFLPPFQDVSHILILSMRSIIWMLKSWCMCSMNVFEL